MATNTTNYNLAKPADNETADIALINGNMDKIDTQMLPENSLESESTKKALAAAQGKVLDGKISALNQSLFKKDGSVQMTGVLKTVGGIGVKLQLDLGNVKVYNTDTGVITIGCNCYYDGTAWRYLNAGKASFFGIDSTTTAPGYYYANAGLKDAQITWVKAVNMLTTETGLPSTGGTLTGAVTLDPINSLGKTVIMKNASDVNDYGTAVTDYNQSNSYAALVLMAVASLNAKAQLYVDGIWYPLYGTHNITVSTAAPSSALTEGAQHQVYA